MRFYSFVKIFSITLCLVLFATGCGKDDPAPTGPTVIGPETIIETTEIQKAHANCFSQGFRPMIEYTEATGNQLYCLFSESQKRCPAIDFLYGDCTLQSAVTYESRIPTSTANREDVFTGPRFCEPVAKPVCGKNGRTYANACIAEQQSVVVIAKGTCAANIEQGNPAVVDRQNTASDNSGSNTFESLHTTNGNSSFDPNNTGKQAVNATPLLAPNTPQDPIITDAGLPDWITVPFSLIVQDVTVIRTEVYRCPVGGNTYYLQTEQRGELFSTLYEEDGALLCNPTNDLADQCPSAFANAKQPNSCKLILAKGKE